MRATVIVFAACAVACVVAHVAILRSVVRTATDRRQVEPGLPRPRLGIEVLWSVIPMVVLGLVLTATWSRIRSEPAPPTPKSILEVAR